jgi:sulfite exporter TauE/SafE
VRHLLYNSGRLTTYCFMGVLAGLLGQIICTPQGVSLSSSPLDLGQRILAIAAGLLMIAMALQFFGLVPNSSSGPLGFGGNTFSASLRSLLGTPGPAAPIAIGVFNGFLPCPLVYAFLAQAASTATAPSGFLVMLAFGLGTFPAMLMMGGIGRFLAPAWRQRGVWLAGSCILLLGLVTLSRGILPLGAHLAHGWLAVPA